MLMSISRPFHVQLLCGDTADPPPAAAADDRFIYQDLPIRRGRPAPQPGFFDCSFEQLMEAMHQLPNFYYEGDGSWSWTAEQLDSRRRPLWRLEGMVYDRDGHVFYVGTQGVCSPAAWQVLTSQLVVPEGKRLAVCLTQQGVWIEADEFHRWLSA